MHINEAADAISALEILRQDGRIYLLGKSARVLAGEAVAVRPNLKTLFTTGYSRNAIVHKGRLDAGVQLVSKAFTFEQLAIRVGDILDQ